MAEIKQDTEHEMIVKARKKALTLLTDRDRTRSELADRLKRAGFSEEIVSDAVAYAESYGYINDERYISRRNETIRNNSSMVECIVNDFKIDDIKMDLIKENKFEIKDLTKETIDELWVGIYFNEDTEIRYDLCRKTYTNHILKADKSITTSFYDTKYMDSKTVNKFVVKLEYVDAIEISKYKTDSRKYIELKKYINEIKYNSNTDWLCDSKSKLSGLIKHGLDMEFVYRACMVDNMVFMIEDVYRNISNGSVYGPIYKTYLD